MSALARGALLLAVGCALRREEPVAPTSHPSDTAVRECADRSDLIRDVRGGLHCRTGSPVSAFCGPDGCPRLDELLAEHGLAWDGSELTGACEGAYWCRLRRCETGAGDWMLPLFDQFFSAAEWLFDPAGAASAVLFTSDVGDVCGEEGCEGYGEWYGIDPPRCTAVTTVGEMGMTPR